MVGGALVDAVHRLELVGDLLCVDAFVKAFVSVEGDAKRIDGLVE